MVLSSFPRHVLILIGDHDHAFFAFIWFVSCVCVHDVVEVMLLHILDGVVWWVDGVRLSEELNLKAMWSFLENAPT